MGINGALHHNLVIWSANLPYENEVHKIPYLGTHLELIAQYSTYQSLWLAKEVLNTSKPKIETLRSPLRSDSELNQFSIFI